MVSQPDRDPSALDALPPRPPTPPREKLGDSTPRHDTLRTRRSLHPRHSLNSRSDLQTPPGHSPHSSDPASSTSARIRKRVDFSGEPQYREPPVYGDKENASKHPTPVSLPASSAASTKPIKSILKASSSLNPLDPSAVDGSPAHADVATMLESTIKQLAGADRHSKLDAYMALVRSLKTSNNLPDRIALQDKMGLFMQFIQRDVTAKLENGQLDSSLANHALTLLATFLHFPGIGFTLTNDFGIFILDHCIRSFEDPTTPKDVIRHLMQVAAFQDFSPKVMTSDRVGRLIAALHKIEEHQTGKSVIMSRVIIYRRLLKQSKTHMATHSDWLLDLFTDMLSSIKEIRTGAIALGLEAAFAIGKEKQLSKRVMEVLQLTVDETRYIEYYVQRLDAMVREKTESAAVPQVWSVVVLLLRCPVDKWEFFADWLGIIQKCFNSSDHMTKVEANKAWCRFVYALQCHENSLSKTISTVCQPFLSQLKRKVTNKHQDEQRRVVLGSICNLFYYAFKPNSSAAQIDSFWAIAVRPLMQRLTSVDETSEKLLAGRRSSASHATSILTGLLDSSQPRIWREDRVAEDALAAPTELPPLDPKWVRKNAGKVFTVVEPIFMQSFLDLADAQTEISGLWNAIVAAVSSAASKEVKVSTDTANFLAEAFNLINKIWSCGIPDTSPQNSAAFLQATHQYLTSMIVSLRPLPFTEKLLTVGQQNTFMPVATPSHRPGKGQGLARSPLHHLFTMLSTKAPGIPEDQRLCDFFKSVFEPFSLAKPVQARRELGNEFMQLFPMDAQIPYAPWAFVSEILSQFLDNRQSSNSSSASDSGPLLGNEFRDVVKHLERGIRSTPGLPWEQWQSLFHGLVAHVTEATGDAGCAIAVIEPIAKVLVEVLSSPEGNFSFITIHSALETIASAKHPRDKHALDAARRRLWGASSAGPRSASADPYDQLYRLPGRLLTISYNQIKMPNEDISIRSLGEAAALLSRCTPSLALKTLENSQAGICAWVQDADGRYSSKRSPRVFEAVKLLWEQVSTALGSQILKDARSRITFEPLLCAAFQSKHTDVVNAVSTVWNQALESVEEVDYSERLKEILLSLRPYVDLVLPGLDVSSLQSTEERQQPPFIESQETHSPILPAPASHEQVSQRGHPSSSRRSTPAGATKLSVPAKRRTESTPPVTRSSKRVSTPRLRHDNSQIHFAAIASSSPALNAAESQHLTERQKEVRERQRENAALFPDLQSDPATTQQDAHAKEAPRAQEVQEVSASTPQGHQRFEDYISSTPTPRRGQAPIMVDEHDMTDDIPSSPPEPRRNLLSEMKPRSRSSSVMEDFHFSSSPISGSPTPHRQDRIAVTMAKATRRSARIRKPEQAGTEVASSISPAKAAQAAEEEISQSAVEEAAKTLQAIPAKSITPPRAEVPTQTQKTPPSDDVFVDALASPTRRSPRTTRSTSAKANKPEPAEEDAANKERSFEVSDGEENSMARLVVELDSRRCDPLPDYCLSSPVQPAEPRTRNVESITVREASSKGKGKRKQGVQASVAALSTSEEPSPASSDNQSASKRKRTSDKVRESGNKKRRRRKRAATDDGDAVDESQISSEAPSSQESVAVDISMEEVVRKTGNIADANAEAIVADLGSPSAMSPDTDAASQQLWTEQASQKSETGGDEVDAGEINDNGEIELGLDQQQQQQRGAAGEQPETEAERGDDSPKSTFERITAALKGGMDWLRGSSLSRDEANKIEDMFFDFKRELYQAESRGRGQ